ncbi:MAG: beta-lactamase family protein [Myxococcales bacterium]|nr:beta-lactamase family protein [Myxococcales bacterium]
MLKADASRLALIVLTAIVAACTAAPIETPEPTELSRATPAEVGMSTEGLSKAEAVIQSFIDKGSIQGAVVGVARRGKVVHFKAHGLFNVQHKIPMHHEAMFNMASSTKPILGVAAMMLIEEGLLSPTDPIAKYVPEFKDAKVAVPDSSTRGFSLVTPTKPVTIADLLTHTSGVSSGKGATKVGLNKKVETLATWVPKLASVPLSFQPGTEWRYGTGLDVVARAIEVASGMPFNTFVQTRIFDPLGMRDTHWIVPEAKRPRMVMFIGGKAGDETTFFSGSAGLVSTARDYLHFEQMLANQGTLFGKRLLKPASVAMMSQNQVGTLFSDSPKGPAGEGFGYTVAVTVDPSLSDNGRGKGVFGWGGAAGTMTWTDPAQELAVVIMVQQPSGLPKAFAKALRDAIVD